MESSGSAHDVSLYVSGRKADKMQYTEINTVIKHRSRYRYRHGSHAGIQDGVM